MSARIAGATLPSVVFDHPLLAALDARSRVELAAACEVRALAAGEPLFSAGSPSDALFVVVAGEVALRAGRRAADQRRAAAGDAVGEEAVVGAHARRRHDARAATSAEVAAVPAALLRRLLARGATSDGAARTRRWLARALGSDLLERADFSRDLPPRARECLLDAGHALELRRGDVVYREGEPADAAYFLGEGMIRLVARCGHEGAAGQPAEGARVLAYHKSGDFFGDEAVGPTERGATATAASDAWIFAVRGDVVQDLARAHPDAFGRALRVQSAARDRLRAIRDGATRNVLVDLHRLETSRSLLAIDQDRCIRCGHCAWSCGQAHDDHVSRLSRSGDVVVATVRGERRTLLLPSSCQHCKNPACMIDCPTGAIARDDTGQVQIREELCTGCGSCAKACPWDNIQMAPRSARRALPIVRTEASVVAIKCDLCQDRGGVAACPVDAIERLEPTVDLLEVASALGRCVEARRAPPRRGRLTPAAVVASAFAAIGLALGGHDLSRGVSGALLLACVGVLFAYAAVKRLGALVRGRHARAFAARPHFTAHLVVGTLALGLAVAHAGGLSALSVAFWTTALLGVGAGLAVVVVPPRLARIERAALPPEALASALERTDARVFRELSGRSDLLKGLYARVLRPFSRSPVVLGRVCALGTPPRTLRDELDARLRGVVGGDDERLEGLDALVAVAVERQALRAQRVLTAVLRGASFAHVVASAGLAALVALHVFLELRGR